MPILEKMATRLWEAGLEGFEPTYLGLPLSFIWISTLSVICRCPQPPHLHLLLLRIPPTPFQQPSGIDAKNVHNKETHIKSKKNFRVFKISFPCLSCPGDQRASRWENKCWRRKQMKEEKFTLGAEKQMVQSVGWSGGYVVEEGPGDTPQKPWQTFNLRRILPPP